jgi:hypothetical protein
VPEVDFTLSEDTKTDKTAYEVCFDLSIIILCLFVTPSGGSQGGKSKPLQLSPSKKVCLYPAKTPSNTAMQGEAQGKENSGPNAEPVLRRKR